MRFITLTKIGRENPAPMASSYSETDEPNENTSTQVVAAPAVETSPTVVNVDAIRCFYPRNQDRRTGEVRAGTRLTFTDGGGFAVTEDFETVKGMIQPQ